MISLGWWRYKKGRGHLMVPLGDDGFLRSRCRRFIIRKPSRELPLLMPSGWIACKDCQKLPEAKEGK